MNNCTYLSKYTNQIIIQNITQRKLLQNENNNNKESYNNKRRSTNINKRSTTISKDNKKINNNDNKIFFNEYLSTDPNEMDYDDVIEKDKRTFCQYFIESIKD